MYHCNVVSLYTIYNDFTRYDIHSAWFLVIRISTCFFVIHVAILKPQCDVLYLEITNSQ